MSHEFLHNPPDENPKNTYVIVSQSKDHINEMFKQAEADVRVARVRLEDAHEKFFGGSWDDERQLAAAEDNLDAAESRLAHSKLKYAWEWGERWKEKPTVTQRIRDYTRGLLLRLDWNILFKRDTKKKTKPPQIEE